MHNASMIQASIGLDNGMVPVRCQVVFWTNAGILLTEPLRTKFSEN